MCLEDLLDFLLPFFVEKQVFQVLRGFNSLRKNVEEGKFLSFNKECVVGFEVFTVVYVEMLICSRMAPRHLANGCLRWEGTCFLGSQG
jgi:hypothetical protein